MTGAATMVIGLFLLSGLAMVIAAAFFMEEQVSPEPVIPDGSALVLAPKGIIVEKRSPVDPFTLYLNKIAEIPQQEELLLQDIIDGVRAAASDDRIKLLVVAPDSLERAGLNQLQDIGAAIEFFKQSGKVVIGFGDSFDQKQYYFASWSDEIYLNPMGSVNLQGFGIFRLYMRDMLDKLSINFHIFKVGTYKSFLEPFIRNDMSPEAKRANGQWLTSLWDGFCADIAKNRGLPVRAVTQAVNNLAINIKYAGGNSAKMAMNNGLIDGVKTRAAIREYLINLVGANDAGTSFKRIDFNDYLTGVSKEFSPEDCDKGIAIIVAQGNIIYGTGTKSQIGSKTLSSIIRELGEDDQVKGVVLRVDSGGGSAFASEIIRQELLLLKEKTGKPLVISMGSMAASGAYWFSADADKIFASSATLTGSIGIFGAFPTVENSLARIGIFSDGIGTTNLAGSGNPTRTLPENLKNAIQTRVEYGYEQFIDIVAQGRNMTTEQVKRIAQGRVWDGATALELGLVDEIGTLEDAVAAAAEMAGLPPDSGFYYQEPPSKAEQFLKSIGAARAALAGSNLSVSEMAHSLISRFLPGYDFLANRDPQNVYSHCLLPGSVLSF